MRRWLRRLALGTALLFGLAIAGVYSWRSGWWVERVEPAAIASLLAPHLEVFAPPGAGPFPAVVQFHGCGGVYENQRQFARAFRDAGFVAVVVDSLTPRALPWQTVCAGRALLGGERAGDVLVAMDHVRGLPNVDARRVVLAGWSHGAWSIMDLLAMDPPHELPHNLQQGPSAGLDGLAGLVLVYPYCGFGTRAEPWRHDAPTLFLFAGRDTIAPIEPCMRVADALHERGVDIETETYANATHAFDESHVSGDLAYDPELALRAVERAVTFVERLR